MNLKFEWDPHKERINIRLHGVTFEQASYVFADPFALNKYDGKHSQNEDRWILSGKSLNEIILVVVHTYRNSSGIERVRIISARKATKNEKQVYDSRCLR